jgi:perosamine synthetase
MDRIDVLSKKYGISVIADAAQAYGALSKGRKLGGLGDIACYSLGRGKVVCGGEGGVLVTNHRHIYEKAISVSQHPLRVFRDVFDEFGNCPDELNWNYRIHPLAAVLALADLKTASERVNHRKMVKKAFAKHIERMGQIKIVDHYPGDETSAYGVPLSFIDQSGKLGSRELFAASFQKNGFALVLGPIKKPIYLRDKFQIHHRKNANIVFHDSHRSGSCQVAERRCDSQELISTRSMSVEP